VLRGKSHGNARLITAAPLDFSRQHVFNEVYRSAELKAKQQEVRLQDVRHPDRRLVLWSQRPGVRKGTTFQAHVEFCCLVRYSHPTGSMTRLSRVLYAPPRLGENIRTEPRIDPSDREISKLALRLTAGLERPADQARELFRHVDREIGNEPTMSGTGISGVECLKNGSGDAAAKSRLLAALCRNRGIPARLVTGLALSKDHKETAHVWVEAWVNGHWMPMCPYYHHLDKVPPTYLIFGFGDMVMARGHNIHDLDCKFLAEHQPHPDPAAEEEGFGLREFMLNCSLNTLPPAETHLVEFLLLLPIAALIICVFRNIVGLDSFGTFAPALIGLAFRELRESWRGILVFISIVLIGWGMRRILDRYHLLQVPRKAFVLSLVVILLITSIVAANSQSVEATRYITLFPMVILTGMIERFWTLEVEDGTASSFKTLFGTMIIAATISLVVSIPAVVSHMFCYPETLGVIMAMQLLIGRYTGYRLSELYRFRDFIKASA
jgi:hypothetical protein